MRRNGVFILLWTCAAPAFAQGLSFSAGEQARGENPSTFVVASDGGAINIFFALPASAQATEVSFDIYRVSGNKEQYHATVKSPVSARKTADKQVWFYDEGRYRIYVYDEHDRLLSKGEFTVLKQP
ncbi:MAG: hypothetical protein NZL95_05690 [Chitinophagales bacterium]|nr:hypothetical protein [Chitinophagales bacterium]MDW8428026.1 hypothetical protein [Chitinophagales bacterium]